MAKGDRRERQARELYRRAGYSVQAFYGRAYGETDAFGEFDLVAMRPDAPPIFCQVKSNRAGGIEDANDRLRPFFPFGRVTCHWAVCHDREGWRLLRVHPEGYQTVVDERGTNDRMGDGIVDYLRGAREL